jgi:D-alanyl-D-alanine dipeptidase
MASQSSEWAALVVAVVLGCDATEPTAEPNRQAAEPVELARPSHPITAEPTPPQVEPPCTLVDPPQGFVDLRAQIPSAIIVAGYHRADNFTGAPLPGYEAAGAWMTAEAADALARAAGRLESEGMRLIIYDAYRPQQASEAMVEWCNAHDRTDLLENGWVAARSNHSRGLAIDVGLADAQGRALDMGSGWDQFDHLSWLHGVKGPALERRLRLRDEMMRVGFEPYTREWWHFTYAATRPSPARAVAYTCVSN